MPKIISKSYPRTKILSLNWSHNILSFIPMDTPAHFNYWPPESVIIIYKPWYLWASDAKQLWYSVSEFCFYKPIQKHQASNQIFTLAGSDFKKLCYPLLNSNIELHSRTKKISPQLLINLSWNSWNLPMAALRIPALPTSWKALIKRFVDDGQTCSLM